MWALKNLHNKFKENVLLVTTYDFFLMRIVVKTPVTHILFN